MDLSIKSGTPEEAAHFLSTIPEFAADAYPPEKYRARLLDKPHLNLLAVANGETVGCKVGYALSKDCFYSWMGGVHPSWRRHGVADMLAEQQEAWARNQGYTTVRFKTRNHCRAMLQFALRRGFNIIAVEPRAEVSENRIWLEKSL
ncbi:GNAT family N-acetyltransferase [Cesiribacter sp. SM1]|uniref:GNAT family N-acetyltransferase n=1 Tax=Cesiribacter sp. SM1 TaxID=2861196 RepID=UPI001CD19F20|nr:GNAT family N-acetyltransferase [Cesiribacter sp. SM1]